MFHSGMLPMAELASMLDIFSQFTSRSDVSSLSGATTATFNTVDAFFRQAGTRCNLDRRAAC